MCGRVCIEIDGEILAEVLCASVPVPVVQGPNIPPGEVVTVIREKNGKRVLSRLRWGLIPSWSKDAKIAWKLINARCETLREKPSFKDSFRHRRCVIPVSGFYEWQKLQNGKKQPFLIRRRDGRPMLLAGLWDAWKGPEGMVETFTIITTMPNDCVRPLHDRMPVILPPEAMAEWIKDKVLPKEQLQGFFRPLSSDLIQVEQADLGAVGVEEVMVDEEAQHATEPEEPEQDVYGDLPKTSLSRNPEWLRGRSPKR